MRHREPFPLSVPSTAQTKDGAVIKQKTNSGPEH